MIFDFRKYKNIHVVGIKGVGAAALSEFLVKNGWCVFGSDVSEDFITTKDALSRLGVPISDFSSFDLSSVDVVIRSVAYNSKNNAVVKEAEDRGIDVFTYPDVISYFFNDSFGVAVAGSHGKTTTTAMLAEILRRSNKNINATVGSKVLEWGSGSLVGDIKDKNSIFVLEADEYKKAFLNYFPKGAIITSVDYDHPDCYKTEDEYKKAFLNFAGNISEDGFLVLNKDYDVLVDIAKGVKCKVIFYGEKDLIDFNLKIPGKHNVQNANAAYLASLELGVSKSDAKKFLEEFSGVARRFDVLYEDEKTVVVDDYAHHPSEIKVTILGARERYPNKEIIAIFQPHTYSRTKGFSDDFSLALNFADRVILTDIYSSAREAIDDTVKAEDLLNMVKPNSIFIKNKENIIDYIKQHNLKKDAVFLFMGAGNIWEVAYDLVENL